MQHPARSGAGPEGEWPCLDRAERRPDVKTLQLETLARRLLREYLEMPGLSLSLAQSTRLSSADVHTCRRALNSLIDAGCLTRTAAGTYTRDASHRSVEDWTSYARRLLAAAQDVPDIAQLRDRGPRVWRVAPRRPPNSRLRQTGSKGALSGRDRDAVVFAPSDRQRVDQDRS